MEDTFDFPALIKVRLWFPRANFMEYSDPGIESLFPASFPIRRWRGIVWFLSSSFHTHGTQMYSTKYGLNTEGAPTVLKNKAVVMLLAKAGQHLKT